MEEKLKAVIAGLETKDSNFELDDFLDADSGRVNRITRRIAEDESERKRLLRILKKFEQAEVRLSSREDSALLFAHIEKEEANALRPPAEADPQPQKVTNGYGKDFKIALQKGIDDLENRKFQNFIRSIYPEAESQRLIAQKQEKYLISKLTRFPILARELIREFRLLQELKAAPLESEGRTVVSFDLPADPTWKKKLGSIGRNIPDQPARKIRFELVNGNWRFFDSNKKIREEMKRQKLGLPAGGGISLEWKRTKQGWRISSIPFF